MKRIAFLGCENSHAKNFLNIIKSDECYSDYEVVGVYSEDVTAAKALSDEFGVKILGSYDEAQGDVDGVVITARHGAKHYEYAKPYIKSGIPMFIDKPITVDGGEAVEFMRELKASGVRICGGSSLKHAKLVRELANDVKESAGGKTLGGIVRAPVDIESVYGGFYFYAQHLVEMLCEIFGRYPDSVLAKRNGVEITVQFSYPEYTVFGVYYDHVYEYCAVRFAKKDSSGGKVTLDGCFALEFAEFDALMRGNAQSVSYDDFIAPVFIMNAIVASLNSGMPEKVIKFKV